MKGMILAAGIGTRLRPITDNIPKCLARAGGRTMLEHAILKLKQVGIGEIVINLHHFPALIKDFIKLNNSFGIDIHFSEEQELLDTGGGLKQAAKYLQGTEPFVLYNADVYTEFNLSELISFQLKHKPLASLLVMERDSDRRLIFSGADELVGYEHRKSGAKTMVREVDSTKALSFCGVHALSPRIFDQMKEQGPKFSIIDTYLSAAKAGEKILSYQMKNDFWIDIGTVEKLNILDQRLNTVKSSDAK